MNHTNPILVVLWCIGFIGAGAALATYAARSVRQGRINIGRPGRDCYRAKEPNAFWGAVVWLVIGSLSGIGIGGFVLVREIIRLIRI